MDGGFLHSGPLLSPPPSSSTSAITHVSLPEARSLPLKAGSNKEAELLRYLDEKILDIQRKFAKREFKISTAGRGYASFQEAATDIDVLVDILWMSGTPRVQIPFLLTLALLVADFIPDFPASARATLTLLDKLDFVFASLLQGRNIETGELLPGFENGRNVTVTEKVRIKSLVDQTRMRVIRVLGAEIGADSSIAEELADSSIDDEPMLSEDSTIGEDSQDDGYERHDSTVEQHEIQISKVYDRTVVELASVLRGPLIGIITDD